MNSTQSSICFRLTHIYIDESRLDFFDFIFIYIYRI